MSPINIKFESMYNKAIDDYSMMDISDDQRNQRIANRVKQFICDTAEDAMTKLVSDYYDLVVEQIRARLGLELEIEVVDFAGGADTLHDGKHLSIRLSKRIEEEMLKYIFVHELGEAEYIARGFPTKQFFPSHLRDRIISRMAEIFSHTFINQRLDYLNLASLIKRQTIEDYAPIKADYEYWDDLRTDEDRIILVVWFFATHPYLWEKRCKLKDYNLFIDKIDRIHELLKAPHLFNSQESVIMTSQETQRIIHEN